MATWKLSKSDVILLMAAMAPFMKSATLSGLCSSRWLLMLIVEHNSLLHTHEDAPQLNLQRCHLRLHVIFDVELVGFFGKCGGLQIVVEDDIDVRDCAFFCAFIHLLSRGIGSN